MERLLRPLALVALTSGLAYAQNDECTSPVGVGLGVSPFDTTAATQSATPWPCASFGGPDLWFTYTAQSSADVLLETCGSGYDTALEVLSGPCSALVSETCNDDACGLQSRIVVAAPAPGDVILFRIGGFNGATGAGTLTVTEQPGPPVPPPATPGCVETLFAANGGGSPGGAMYFDVTASQPVLVDHLLTNYLASPSTPVGVSVYTTPGTYLGNESNLSAWTLAATDDGTAVAGGFDEPTVIRLASPLAIPAGTTGVALLAIGSGHAYTNGNGSNQTAVGTDGNLVLELGAASNVPFGAATFTPRVWNGRLCPIPSPPIGTPYCAAQPNSTGSAASIAATGSNFAAANDVTLVASGMPANRLGLFVASETQAATPVASGTLCLGGTLIRFQGPGQLRQSDANGAFALRIDTSALPAGLPTPILPGDTWNFTAWYQDTAPGGATTANFTDGVSVGFQ